MRTAGFCVTLACVLGLGLLGCENKPAPAPAASAEPQSAVAPRPQLEVAPAPLPKPLEAAPLAVPALGTTERAAAQATPTGASPTTPKVAGTEAGTPKTVATTEAPGIRATTKTSPGPMAPRGAVTQ